MLLFWPLIITVNRDSVKGGPKRQHGSEKNTHASKIGISVIHRIDGQKIW